MLFGLTCTDVRRMAYQLADRNNLQHYFNQNKKMAGWVWLRSFMKRNLSLRGPEATTSAARARGFTKPAVGKFFELLKPLQERHAYPPSKIFNVDETGLTTVQGRPSKVIAMKGRKQVGTLTSAERETLHCSNMYEYCRVIYSTHGYFPRVRSKEEFSLGLSPESIVACHPSGWMQMNLFEKWFDHFFFNLQIHPKKIQFCLYWTDIKRIPKT